MANSCANSDKALKRSVTEADLLTLVRELVNELRGGRSEIDVRPASRLERDLGIDSLGRTELMLRIEQRFSIQLAVSAMGEVETAGDLLRIVNQGKGARASTSGPAITPALPEVQAAAQARTLLEMLDWHVARHPDRLHATVLQDDSTVIATLSYAGLARPSEATKYP